MQIITGQEEGETQEVEKVNADAATVDVKELEEAVMDMQEQESDASGEGDASPIAEGFGGCDNMEFLMKSVDIKGGDRAYN